VAIAGLVLVATVVSGRDKGPDAGDLVAAPVERAARAPADTTAHLDLERLQRRGKETVIGNNIFGAPEQPPAPAAPQDAPRAAAEPAPPPAPEAPPLPFRYLGQMVEDGRKLVFLARDDTQISVQAGQTIGKEYRVDQIAKNEITLTYLPAGIRQSLAIPALE
jgi:hypothetical protein